ncbi:MAG: hypothetical protein PWP55_812 [Clostridiales bacterium]|nr:hypothetical protein [Clostridiales bacterium]
MDNVGGKTINVRAFNIDFKGFRSFRKYSLLSRKEVIFVSTRQNIIRKCTCFFLAICCGVFLLLALSACDEANMPINNNSNSSVERAPKISEQVNKFLKEHNLTLADKPGWVPSEILNYSNGIDEALENKLKDNIKGYITSIEDGKVEINEVEWISNTNEDSGFDILDSSPDTVQYLLSEDVEVWILTEMVYIQIPLQDLKPYLAKFNHTLWNIGVKEDKITTLIEQYVP